MLNHTFKSKPIKKDFLTCKDHPYTHLSHSIILIPPKKPKVYQASPNQKGSSSPILTPQENLLTFKAHPTNLYHVSTSYEISSQTSKSSSTHPVHINMAFYNQLRTLDDQRALFTKKCLKEIKKGDIIASINTTKINCVSIDILSEKFRFQKEEKYTGDHYLKAHLRIYYHKTAKVVGDKKSLIYHFHESLTGTTLT